MNLDSKLCIKLMYDDPSEQNIMSCRNPVIEPAIQIIEIG
jgi:hypothetical protein